jgi:hypothetical protein
MKTILMMVMLLASNLNAYEKSSRGEDVLSFGFYGSEPMNMSRFNWRSEIYLDKDQMLVFKTIQTELERRHGKIIFDQYSKDKIHDLTFVVYMGKDKSRFIVRRGHADGCEFGLEEYCRNLGSIKKINGKWILTKWSEE